MFGYGNLYHYELLVKSKYNELLVEVEKYHQAGFVSSGHGFTTNLIQFVATIFHPAILSWRRLLSHWKNSAI
jgi:hypothetical protein